jgi:hypothetical protein
MRLALLALTLWFPCALLQAQHAEKEPKKPAKSQGHTVSKGAQPPKGQVSPAAKQQRAQDGEERHRKPKHSQSFDPARPQDQRARERVPGDPPPDHRAHTVSKDSQPPKGAPSPAWQLQQKQAEQFQERSSPQRQPAQAQRQTRQPNRDNDGRGTVQCTARPVCGGNYGSCQDVTQTYAAASVGESRRDIVQQCVQANTPDSCRCAAQCERVARCSIF